MCRSWSNICICSIYIIYLNRQVKVRVAPAGLKKGPPHGLGFDPLRTAVLTSFSLFMTSGWLYSAPRMAKGIRSLYI